MIRSMDEQWQKKFAGPWAGGQEGGSRSFDTDVKWLSQK